MLYICYVYNACCLNINNEKKAKTSIYTHLDEELNLVLRKFWASDANL